MSAAVLPNRIPALGFVDASTRSVQEQSTPVPYMRTTLNNWQQAITLTRIRKNIVDHEEVEQEISETTRGVLQPMSAQRISMKPDGQRAWIWNTLHTTIDLILGIDEKVIINGTRFRVAGKLGYAAYGYVEYELVQDYANPNA